VGIQLAPTSPGFLGALVKVNTPITFTDDPEAQNAGMDFTTDVQYEEMTDPNAAPPTPTPTP